VNYLDVKYVLQFLSAQNSFYRQCKEENHSRVTRSVPHDSCMRI